jgi:hypothetical protein
MPGKTPYDAYSAFVTPLANALSCIGFAKIQPSEGGKSDLNVDHNLYITGTQNDGFIRLQGDPALQFRARMRYQLIADSRPDYGPFRATTLKYDYSIRLASGERIVDYHWHPTGSSHETRPHMHIASAQLSATGVIKKADHLPTGRMTFENVIRGAIQLGAVPVHEDWQKRLEGGESLHIQYRTWS